MTLTPRGDWGAATFGMGPRPPALVDARGAFEIRGVTPGPYTLTAMSIRDGNPTSATVPVEAGTADIDGLELALKPGVEVKGKVRFDGDSSSSPSLAGLTVNLMPAQASMGFAGLIGAPVDAEGSFNLRNVMEGDYRVKLNPMAEDAYIKTVTYGGDATKYPLTVGEAPGKLEVVLAVAGGQVEGMVTDGDKPVAGALVTAVPESGREDLVKVGRTDSSGHYTIRGLAPGDYTLYACDDRADGFSADPEALKAYRDKGKTIAAEEKSKATADLALSIGISCRHRQHRSVFIFFHSEPWRAERPPPAAATLTPPVPPKIIRCKPHVSRPDRGGRIRKRRRPNRGPGGQAPGLEASR